MNCEVGAAAGSVGAAVDGVAGVGAVGVAADGVAGVGAWSAKSRALITNANAVSRYRLNMTDSAFAPQRLFKYSGSPWGQGPHKAHLLRKRLSTLWDSLAIRLWSNPRIALACVLAAASSERIIWMRESDSSEPRSSLTLPPSRITRAMAFGSEGLKRVNSLMCECAGEFQLCRFVPTLRKGSLA